MLSKQVSGTALHDPLVTLNTYVHAHTHTHAYVCPSRYPRPSILTPAHSVSGSLVFPGKPLVFQVQICSAYNSFFLALIHTHILHFIYTRLRQPFDA